MTPVHSPRPATGSWPAAAQSPARTAARATAALVLVPCVLLTHGLGQAAPAAAGRPAAAPSAAAGVPFDVPSDHRPPGALGDPADAPGTAAFPGPTEPTAVTYQGLGTVSSCDSGRRIDALDSRHSDVSDGTVVGAVTGTGADGEEWVVWPAPDGELILQSLLSSGAPEPRVVTAEPGDLVDLQHDRTGSDADAGAQHWRFSDRTALLRLTADGARPPGCFRIRAHRGGCLLDRGEHRPLAVGDCGDRTAWWTDQGLYDYADE